ncbi:hypothetical protein [Deinococcus petrolearius]|uniref:Uncharacterized protein n=1 Tax=Deinococcus petrolearius TaxID=1751295 RepID=A0ABW1DL49_9DEIO
MTAPLPANPVSPRRRQGAATLLIHVPRGEPGKVVRGVVALQHPYRRVRYAQFSQRLGHDDEQETTAFVNNVTPLIQTLPRQQPLNVVLQTAHDAARYRALLRELLGERTVTSGAPQGVTTLLQRVAQYGLHGGVAHDLAHDCHLYITALSDGGATLTSSVLLLPWRVTWSEARRETGDTTAASFQAMEDALTHLNPRTCLAVFTNNPMLGSILQRQAAALGPEAKAAATQAQRYAQERGITASVLARPDPAIGQVGRMLVARAFERGGPGGPE